jgi:hypothetical protein
MGNCSCSVNGTALCYHVNGNCFCRQNYYGRTCELYCPFGYLDGVCHTVPMKAGFCSCASDLYRCDNETGCVCKDGFDCEGGTHFIDFASLRANEESSSHHATYVSVIATVLLLALIITVLFVIYYRRRMRRMQKDLEHRSVRYIENSVQGHHQEIKKNELVISNSDPLDEMEPKVYATNNASAAANNSNATRNNEKNVNIDKFKLGVEEGQEGEASTSTQGACALANVNLFQENGSPTKEKNNAKLADLYRKANKTNNVRELQDNAENRELEDEDDEDMEPKMRLKKSNNQEQ